MPLFTRRRLQAMIDEVRPHVPDQKLKAFVACLNDKRIEQVLGAEAELALAWAFRRTHDAEIEPNLPGTERGPDLKMETFAGSRAWIEVTAVSDADYAGDKKMRRIAQRLVEMAGSARQYLQFEFDEEMGYDADGFYRRLLAPDEFTIDDALRSEFKHWLTHKSKPLLVERPGLRLMISHRSYALDHLDYRGRTVPTLYDLEKNPVYGRLDYKRRRGQLPVGNGDLCGVILWDAGCWAMRNSFFSTPHGVSLDAIIRHFIDKSGVDFVGVFTQSRSTLRRGFDQPAVTWRTTTTLRHGDPRERAVEAEIAKVVRALPHPRFEGYQVRSYQDRKLFDPRARGWYIAPVMVSDPRTGKTIMKVSARALQEALATQDFRGVSSEYASGGDKVNPFLRALMSGQVITACHLEPAGLDADDDYLVFEFGSDASASKFTTGLVAEK